MRGDLTASKHLPKGPAPLRLGTNGEGLHVVAEIMALPESGQEVACLVSADGAEAVRLTKRGATALSDWLRAWARPRVRMKLWGIAAIAREHGVSRGTAERWADHPSFPRPVGEVDGAGRVWEAILVRDWVKRDRPRPGRPKKKRRA